MSKPIKMGLHYDMPDDQYHQQHDAKDHYYSSSQLKDILKDPLTFKQKYITQEAGERGFVAAFEFGTYVHTAILEPEKLAQSTAIYEGATRRGKAWEEFLEANEGKTILTRDKKKETMGGDSEYSQAQKCIEAVGNSEIAMELLAQGQPEVSLFYEYEGVKLKVRADWIDFKRMLIADLKTTSSSPRSADSIRKSTKDYGYDLSAAMYMLLFNQYIKHEGHPTPKKDQLKEFTDFYWIYAGKKDFQCQCYMAHQKMLDLGLVKFKEAIRLIKYYESINWEIPETCPDLAPASWEVSDWENVGPSKNDDASIKIKETKKVNPALML